jgi:hypothetical protein
MSPPVLASAAWELALASAPKSAPGFARSRVKPWMRVSAGCLRSMNWMTCQPNCVSTGGRISFFVCPVLKIVSSFCLVRLSFVLSSISFAFSF